MNIKDTPKPYSMGGRLMKTPKIKKVCLKCASWTRNKAQGSYKCYCGSCPAKARDERDKLEKFPVLQRRINRLEARLNRGLK
jgi:hypothetical protein